MVRCLDIVIVNWNAGKHLVDCLGSIAACKRTEFDLARVVVVDNASSDGSMERLEEIALPLTIIRNRRNRGFAAACNQGAMGSRADYLLFLNPDMSLLPDSLVAPLRFMKSPESSSIGICGIQLVDKEGNIECSCSRFPTCFTFLFRMLGLDRLFPKVFQWHFLEKSAHLQSREVDVVTGAFMMLRRPLFEALGGFDERFFVYLEELDLSLRAYEAGWKSYYLSTAQAYHEEEGCSRQAKDARLFYVLRSRILYGQKHFSLVAATILLIAICVVEPLFRLAWAVWRGSIQEMRETLGAYAKLGRALPSLVHNLASSDRSPEIGSPLP